MKKLFLILIISWIAFSCSIQRYKISGNIKDMDDVPIALQISELKSQKLEVDRWVTIDSTRINNGKFLFKGKMKHPQMMRLKFGDDLHYMNFFGEYGKIHVDAHKDSLLYADIEGSKLHAKYQAYKTRFNQFRRQWADASWDYQRNMKAGDKEGAKNAQNKMREISKRQRSYALNFVMNHKNTVLAPLILESFIYRMEYEKLDSLYNSFHPKIKESKYAKPIKKQMEFMESCGVGAKYKSLVLRDTSDNIVNLSDYIGDGYVLIEFWASWCGPCRKENPKLRKIYNKYNGRDFEIIGITYDTNDTRKFWLKAIHKDSLLWPQFRDPTPYMQSNKKYDMRGIPSNYLINPKGKIIAKNLSSKELDKKLNKLYSNE
jgi:thiol-disulfide isomerase/thioredoxin